MPVASGLSGKNSAEVKTCSQEVRRASWRREHEPSFDSWSQKAIDRIMQPLYIYQALAPA